MGDIIKWDGYTKNALLPSEVLKAIADEPGVKEAFIVCWREDDTLTFHATHPDDGRIFMALETFKHKVLSGEFG